MVSNSDVVGAIGGGSEPPKMRASQIIEKSVVGILPKNVTPGKFVATLMEMLKNPNYKLVQVGNTVFLVTKIDNESVETHFFSSEPFNKLLGRYIELCKALKGQGFKYLYTYTDRPAYTKMAQSSGLSVEISQVNRMQGDKMTPMYQIKVNL